MKKTYIMPEVEIVNVELQNVVAASPLGDPEDGFTPTGAPSLGEETNSGNMSRGSSLWDDED